MKQQRDILITLQNDILSQRNAIGAHYGRGALGDIYVDSLTTMELASLVKRSYAALQEERAAYKESNKGLSPSEWEAIQKISHSVYNEKVT